MYLAVFKGTLPAFIPCSPYPVSTIYLLPQCGMLAILDQPDIVFFCISLGFHYDKQSLLRQFAPEIFDLIMTKRLHKLTTRPQSHMGWKRKPTWCCGLAVTRHDNENLMLITKNILAYILIVRLSLRPSSSTRP